MLTINASEIAAVVGLNPYKSREEMAVKYRKPRGNSIKVKSQRAETIAIGVYETAHDTIVDRRQSGAYFSPSPEVRIYAQIDGVANDPIPHIIEIKNRKSSMIRCTSENHYDILQLVVEILAHNLPGRVVELYNSRIINETKIYTIEEARDIYERYIATNMGDFPTQIYSNQAPTRRKPKSYQAGCMPDMGNLVTYLHMTVTRFWYGDTKQE